MHYWKPSCILKSEVIIIWQCELNNEHAVALVLSSRCVMTGQRIHEIGGRILADGQGSIQPDFQKNQIEEKV